VSNAGVAGEKVGGEQKLEVFAVEAHMAAGMPGEMDGPQPMPNVDAVPVVEQAVGDERMKAQKRPADALQTTGNSCPAAIAWMPGVMVGVEARSGDPGASLPGNGGDVEDMVKVPVSNDDAANRLVLPAPLPKGTTQKETSADESGIEQIQSGCVSKDIGVERWRSDLENVGRQISVYGPNWTEVSDARKRVRGTELEPCPFVASWFGVPLLLSGPNHLLSLVCERDVRVPPCFGAEELGRQVRSSDERAKNPCGLNPDERKENNPDPQKCTMARMAGDQWLIVAPQHPLSGHTGRSKDECVEEKRGVVVGKGGIPEQCVRSQGKEQDRHGGLSGDQTFEGLREIISHTKERIQHEKTRNAYQECDHEQQRHLQRREEYHPKPLARHTAKRAHQRTVRTAKDHDVLANATTTPSSRFVIPLESKLQVPRPATEELSFCFQISKIKPRQAAATTLG
jgi:hypothetical protein